MLRSSAGRASVPATDYRVRSAALRSQHAWLAGTPRPCPGRGWEGGLGGLAL